jgi:hypothetical protein
MILGKRPRAIDQSLDNHPEYHSNKALSESARSPTYRYSQEINQFRTCDEKLPLNNITLNIPADTNSPQEFKMLSPSNKLALNKYQSQQVNDANKLAHSTSEK